MKIALLVPSRERMNNRLTLLCSILTTVYDHNNITLYFGVDKDDPTIETIKNVSKCIPFVKIIEIDNGGKFLGLGKLWNILTENSSEEIISMIGDDMTFNTKHWDLEILKEFSNLPKDKIQAIHCNDGYHGNKLAVNLFCHRQYANVLGKFMREEFKINWVDQWMHQLFSAFGRLKYRGDIMIEHRHWVLGKNNKDRVAERMAIADTDKISDKLWHDLVDERIKDVKTLQQYLNIKPNWSVVDTGNKVIT